MQGCTNLSFKIKADLSQDLTNNSFRFLLLILFSHRIINGISAQTITLLTFRSETLSPHNFLLHLHLL